MPPLRIPDAQLDVFAKRLESIGVVEADRRQVVRRGQVAHQMPRAQLAAFVERQQEIRVEPEDAHAHECDRRCAGRGSNDVRGWPSTPAK